MGAEAEFDAFVRDRSRALLRAAWLLTGDWPAAEDLVQTTLLAVWQRWDRAMRDGTPHGYAHVVMTSRFLDLRRRRSSREIPTASLVDRVDPADPDVVDLHVAIEDAMATLTRRQRAAVVLRYFLDLSERDAAAAMRCSTGAVKTHLSRALDRMRTHPGLVVLLTPELADD